MTVNKINKNRRCIYIYISDNVRHVSVYISRVRQALSTISYMYSENRQRCHYEYANMRCMHLLFQEWMVIINDGTLSQVRGGFSFVPPGIFTSTTQSQKKTPPPQPRCGCVATGVATGVAPAATSLMEMQVDTRTEPRSPPPPSLSENQ